jgi:hypothetical protein
MRSLMCLFRITCLRLCRHARRGVALSLLLLSAAAASLYYPLHSAQEPV